jgi:hypothetical protein
VVTGLLLSADNQANGVEGVFGVIVLYYIEGHFLCIIPGHLVENTSYGLVVVEVHPIHGAIRVKLVLAFALMGSFFEVTIANIGFAGSDFIHPATIAVHGFHGIGSIHVKNVVSPDGFKSPVGDLGFPL